MVTFVLKLVARGCSGSLEGIVAASDNCACPASCCVPDSTTGDRLSSWGIVEHSCGGARLSEMDIPLVLSASCSRLPVSSSDSEGAAG